MFHLGLVLIPGLKNLWGIKPPFLKRKESFVLFPIEQAHQQVRDLSRVFYLSASHPVSQVLQREGFSFSC